MTQYRRQRDANHKPIADELTKRGVDVDDLSAIGKFPDLLCRYRKFGGFIEIKIPGSRTTYQRLQLKWISETTWPVAIVTNAEDAMRFLETGEGLTRKQKDALAAFLVQDKADKWHPAAIERVLAR